jgi:hypothetical protein
MTPSSVDVSTLPELRAWLRHWMLGQVRALEASLLARAGAEDFDLDEALQFVDEQRELIDEQADAMVETLWAAWTATRQE